MIQRESRKASGASGAGPDGFSTQPSPDRDQSRSASTSFVTSVSIASASSNGRDDRDSSMNRPYTAHSPYSLSPTERMSSHGIDDRDTVDDRGRYDDYP